MLLVSLRHAACAKQILTDGLLSAHLTHQLCALYTSLPSVMDPSDVAAVDAKWGWVGVGSLWFNVPMQLVSITKNSPSSAFQFHQGA